MSKYLPTGIPPWQITIIPTTDDLHYILLKMHHMLLHEGLNVADLLPLIPSLRPGVRLEQIFQVFVSVCFVTICL